MNKLITVSDHGSEAAANYTALKLMGCPGVQLGIL